MIHRQSLADVELHWYVLYVKPRTEKKVGERLKSLGFEAFVPVQRQVRQWSDRKKIIEAVLFPRYVFILSSKKRKNIVFELSNVIRFIQFGGVTATLSESEIQLVRDLERLSNPVQIEQRGFVPGEEVEIISGSLTGYKGKIMAVSGSTKITLALPGLQCFASVELRNINVKKLTPTHNPA